MVKVSEETKQVVYSYVRSAVAAVLTVWWTGETSTTALIKAAVAAVVPPVLRWLNPNDAAFGRTGK